MSAAARLGVLERRLNAQAYPVLCAELVRLAAENERLRAALVQAEDCAEGWREDAMAALDCAARAGGGAPGLTLDGRLVLCPAAGVAA
jgi:hypothetical protein